MKKTLLILLLVVGVLAVTVTPGHTGGYWRGGVFVGVGPYLGPYPYYWYPPPYYVYPPPTVVVQDPPVYVERPPAAPRSPRRAPRTGTTARAPRATTRRCRAARRSGSRFRSARRDPHRRAPRRCFAPAGRRAAGRLRVGSIRPERHGVARHREELRAVPGGRLDLPAVGLSAGRDHRAEGRDGEHRRRRRDRHPGGRRCGRRAGRRRRQPGIGAAAGAGVGLLGGTAIGAGPRRRLRRLGAASLRHDLHAVHVRQGQPGTGRPRLAGAAAGLHLAAASTATSAPAGSRGSPTIPPPPPGPPPPPPTR